jgi:hypothetical protein
MIYVPPYPMSKRSKLRKDVHGVPNKLGVENQQSKKNFVQGSVAEPPKLYGLYVLVIVLKTSNNYTCIPQNLKSLSVSSGNPNHPQFTTHTGATKE